jgi:two-component system nitrate/nitrite response regulator NarL
MTATGDSVVRVLIVAAVRLYRDGLAQSLRRIEGFEVVRITADPAAGFAAVSELHPDVVLLDMDTPGSYVAASSFDSLSPGTRVVAVGVPDAEGDVLACVEAGVAGYVSREGSLEDLVAAIRSAARGEFLCSPRIAGTLLRRVASLVMERGPEAPPIFLTLREREVVRLIDEGLSNKDIARRLGIEVATVKNHVHNLLEKLHVHRRAEAAARVRGYGPWRTPPRGISA